MSKLHFRYGAMGSAKTARLLTTKFNYEERNQTALIAKPSIDTKGGEHTVESRIGITGECITVEELPKYLDDMCARFKQYICNADPTLTQAEVRLKDLLSCILVDESQFLTKEQVEFLAMIVDTEEIPVICYGLKTDFQGNLFPGSKRLMELADVIEEEKTVCWCGKAARFNARINLDGEIIREGPQVEIGGNEKYISLCRKHFFEGVINQKGRRSLNYK